MKEYIKEKEIYERDKLVNCTCDRCGKKCDLKENNYQDFPEYANIQINPKWATEGYDYRTYQLCYDCTIKILDFFTNVNPVEIKEWKDDLKDLIEMD